jgi:branched-chain amino acid transport system substrate-binding protein
MAVGTKHLTRRAFLGGIAGTAAAAILAACGGGTATDTPKPAATTGAAATTAPTTAAGSAAAATRPAGSATSAPAGTAAAGTTTTGATGTTAAGSAPSGTAVIAAKGPAKLTDGKLVLAVLNDQSGAYADISGKNTTKLVKQAVDDFTAKYGKEVFGGTVEVIDADHQNKPDVANAKASEFYDRNAADVILDVPTSSCGLAVAAVAKAKKRLYMNVGSATTELNGAQCNRYTFHYAYDTYMLANGTGPWETKNVGKKWYLVYPDYAFGQDMVKSFTDAITKSGGTVVGADPSPFPSSGDFSSYLLKAPGLKPDIIGSMHAGNEVVNFVKQYNEFKLRDQKIALAIGLLFDSDIKALGPDAFQGITYTTAWLWTLDDQARAWADMAKKVIGVRPTFAHAGNYSAAWQYMDAVRRAGTDDPDAVIAQLEGYQFNDFFARNATIRKEDHNLIHDVYLAQVKPLKENAEEGDYSKILATTPGKEAFRPDGQTGCTMSA